MANKRLLQDGSWFDQGLGTLLRYIDGVVYMDDDLGQTWKVVGDELVLVSTPIRTESPGGWTVPTNGLELVDANLDVWTIGAAHLVLKNGVSMGVTALSITITTHIVKRLGLDSHIYAWNGLVWTDETVVVLTESPDGWTVPTDGNQLVDANLDIWTIGASNGAVLKNGAGVLGATASLIRIVSHVVKRDGLDGHRYAWTGTAWTDEGIIIPVILGDANGTRGQTVIDRNGKVNTLNLANNAVFIDGVNTSGWGAVLLMANDRVHHLGVSTRHWYYPGTTFDSWIDAGVNNPHTGAVPATRSINGTESSTVVFPTGLTWTRGAAVTGGFEALREGVRMQNAACTSYLVYGDRLYWKDSTNNWWQFGGLTDGSGGMNSVGYYGTRDPRDPIIPPGGPLRYVVTTGNIALGSSILTSVPTAAYNTLLEGDCVVVEITTGMGRGSGRGPGGSHPMRSYATYAALPNPAGEGWMNIAWVEDTKHVYEVRDTNGDGSGTKYWWDLNGNTAMNRRLECLVLARSIHARIRTKNVGELTLEDFNGNLISCQAGMTGANVYLNVIPELKAIIDALAPGTPGYEMPAGQYPGAGVLWIDRPGFILTGMGMTSTEFFSPRGVNPVGVSVMPNINGCQFKDFKINSNNYPDANHDPDWYGLNWTDGTPTLPWPTLGNFWGISDYSGYTARQIGTIPSGMSGYSNQDVLVERVWTNGYLNQAFGSSYCINWLTRSSKATIDVVSHTYDGWACGHYDSINSGMEDCELVAYSAVSGCEQFKSTGGFFRRLAMTNWDMALNSAGGWLIEDCVQRYTTDCCKPGSYQGPHHPCLNVNTNISAGYPELGGIIRRHDCRQAGYVRGGCATKEMILVNHENPGIRIEGAYCSAPDWNDAVLTYPPDEGTVRYPSGALGLVATGQNTLVGGMAVDGLSHQHYIQSATNEANIYNRGGWYLSGYGPNRGDPRTLAKWGVESVFAFNFWP